MSAEIRAFLSAIAAAPEDDLPRLVFADWLEENGQGDFAEFIRVDCAWHRLVIARDGIDEYHKHSDRHRELYPAFQTHADQVKALLKKNRELHLLPRRGVVGVVWCTVRYFCLEGRLLFDLLPVERIRVSRLSPANAATLGSCGHWAMIRELHVGAMETRSEAVIALIDTCDLTRLRSFTFDNNVIAREPSAEHGQHTAVAERIARCESFGQLKRLNMSGARIGTTGARALATSSVLSQLEILDVMHNNLSEAAVALLRERFGDALIADYPDRQRFARY